MMFGLIPKEEAFFDLFKKAAHNMIEGSRLLKEMMEHFQEPVQQAKRIKDVEHVGDGITHDIALRLNQTFITPIDREDIHDLASALDDILDVTEAIADRFVIYKIGMPTDTALRLADILYQASVAVGCGVDRLGMTHSAVTECAVQVNSLENEADRLSRDAISALFEKETDPIAVIKWKEIYENFEAGTDRCEDVANILERIALKHH
jgi:predicted phosphate transport protein (TIGR00153 family)